MPSRGASLQNVGTLFTTREENPSRKIREEGVMFPFLLSALTLPFQRL